MNENYTKHYNSKLLMYDIELSRSEKKTKNLIKFVRVESEL